MDAITLAYSVAVPHRSQSPFHQRHRLFLGMVQGDVHFGNLWGGRMGLAIHICKVLQPGCPWHRLESFLLKLAILWVHLTNIVQAPPSLSLSILYGRQVSTYGTTPRPQMTLWLSLCLVNSLDLPWVLLPRESWCWVIPHHSTVWLYLLPYFDAVRVKYRKGMYSVTIITSVPWHMERVLRSWPCYELHSSVTFFWRNLRCDDEALYSQTPLPFWWAMAGCIARGSRAAAESLVCFLVLHEPMDVQFHCVIIKRLQLKRKKIFFPIQVSSTQYLFHISGNRGYDSNWVQ